MHTTVIAVIFIAVGRSIASVLRIRTLEIIVKQALSKIIVELYIVVTMEMVLINVVVFTAAIGL